MVAKEYSTPPVKELLNALIDKAVRSGDFGIKAQAALLHVVCVEWKALPEDIQQQLRTRLVPIIPRLRDSANPEAMLDRIIECYTMFPERSATDIAKCLRAALPTKPYIGDPDEYLFPKQGWIAEFIRINRDSEVPIAFHFWSAVSTIGAACKFKVLIDRSQFDLRMNWYTLLVGSKATGKSLSKDSAQEIVHRMNRMLNPVTPFKDTPPKYGTIRMLAEDSTKESIIEELAFDTKTERTRSGLLKVVSIDSAGFLLIDELANMLGRQSYAVETKIPFFTALYAARVYRKSTVTSTNAELRNCALSMLACCAPDWLLESVTPVMFRGGFLDRFRIVYRPDKHTKRSYPTPGPRDPVMCNILAAELIEWAELEEELELLPTEDAEHYYNEWYERKKLELEEEINHDGLSLHRLANQLWKLAGILCISDGRAPYIAISHIDTAERILANEEKYVRELMQVITQDPLVAQLEYVEQMMLKGGGMVLKRLVHDRLRRKKGFMPFNRVGIRFLEDLISNGNIMVVGLGKPNKDYYQLTEVGLSHLNRSAVNKKLVDAARIAIRRHTRILDAKLPSD